MEEFTSRIENFVDRIGDIVRTSSMSVEEATQFTIRETMLAGGEVRPGDRRLRDTMETVSGVTGMSYEESLNAVTSGLGSWGASSFDLIPMAEAAGVNLMAADVASRSGGWETSWMRAGGPMAVGQSYNALGAQYWGGNIDRMAWLYSQGNLNDATLERMAEGEDVFADYERIEDPNARYEARYMATQQMATRPRMMAAAGFGSLIQEMNEDEVYSRRARIMWLNDPAHGGFDIATAESMLDLHDQTSTEGGRFGTWLAGSAAMASEVNRQIRSDLNRTMPIADIMSGEDDPFWASMMRHAYRSDVDWEGHQLEGGVQNRLQYARDWMDEYNVPVVGELGQVTAGWFWGGVFAGGQGAGNMTTPEGERRLSIANLGTATSTQLRDAGFQNTDARASSIDSWISKMR